MDRGPGQGDRLDADAFVRLAAHLEQYAEAGLRRVGERDEWARRALVAGRTAGDHWTGEHADTFATYVDELGGRVTGVEPRCGDAYRALAELAPEARRVAEVIREVEWREKSWNQQVVANGTEWLDRITTAAAAGLPWSDGEADARSAEKTAWHQNETRLTEEASERRRVALARWDERCGIAAAKVRDATAALLNALMLEPPRALPVRGSYHPDAARDAVRRSWAGLAERVVKDRQGDTEQLRAWWAGLDPDERIVLMEHRPDLIAGPLWGVLSRSEAQYFHQQDTFTKSSGAWEAEFEGTFIGIRLKGALTAGDEVASDGSVEATLEMSRELAVGLWEGKVAGADAGALDKLVVTCSFASPREYQQAVTLLQYAVNADLGKGDRSMSHTMRVLRDQFFVDGSSTEEAVGVSGTLAGSVGLVAGIEAESKLVAGVFDNERAGERGLFLEGGVELEGSHPQVEGRSTAAVEGRLVVDDDGRRYLRLSLTADASASPGLLALMGAGGALPQPIPEGLRAVELTVDLELTDEHAPVAADFLAGVAGGRLDPAAAARLHDLADVTVVASTGSRRMAPWPVNPFIDALLARSETETVTARHKPAGGDYYEQGAR